MIRFRSYISEGVYDPNIFKAIFLAGGPGSGKSYVTDKVIGGTGLRIVNSDNAFTHLLKKSGLSLKMPDNEEHERMQKLVRAKEITAKQTKLLMNGRLGMVIDGTGGNYNIIKEQVDELRDIGYDTYMIFVNTSLETALARNKARPRTIPENIVTKSWKLVQQNIGKFQNLFKVQNYIIIDNNSAKEDIFKKVFKEVRGLLRTPLKNYKAKNWIKSELGKKKK